MGGVLQNRDGGIRTRDPTHPKGVRYRAAPRPERQFKIKNSKCKISEAPSGLFTNKSSRSELPKFLILHF